nr:YadA-like family protein [Burkholderia cenocepacia]
MRTTAIGTLATGNGTDATAIGTSSNASGKRSIAIGAAATDLTNGAGTETGQNTTDNTAASGDDSIAFGTGARASSDRAMAFGTGASAVTNDGVALGSGSVADRAAGQGGSGLAAISVGKTGATRQIINVAAGTADTDAVNVGQMNTGLSTTNAAIAATNAELSTTNTTLAATNATLSTASTNIATLQGDMASAKTGISTNTSDITKLNDKLGELSSGAIGLVQQAGTGADLTVGASTDGAAVNFAGTAGNRKLTGVKAGTDDTDAVNVGQMNTAFDAVNTGLSTTNAALDATNATLSTTTIQVGALESGLSSANVQIGSLDSGLSTANSNIAQHTTDITTINDKLSELSNGTVGLVQQAAVGDDLTVGAKTDGAAVNFAGTAGDRKLTGIKAGTNDTDAVNVGQMNAGLSTTNAAIAGLDGRVSTNETAITNLDGRLTTSETKITNIDNRVTANEGSITSLGDRVTVNEGAITKLADQLGSGTLGLVQQAAAGDDLTVGAKTDGAAVNFAGTAGNRKLTGIAAGDVSAASTDAINGSQLHGVSDSVASAIGGGATVNADGSISSPAFTVGDGSGGTKVVNSVGDVVTNLDGRVVTNEGAISKLADEIGSGTLGLVQQAAAGDDLTVGAKTDGAAVNFAGTAGNRKLTGIAVGDVSAASTDAINGSQLHGVSDSVASAIGGGATVNADGSISAPAFTVGDGSGGTKVVNSVGDVVTNLDGRVTTNEGAISKLASDIGSGTLGLVQQNPTTGAITVAATTGGTTVNFAGSGGTLRKLSGVANGVDDDDVVTVSQLRATGLIDYTGKEVGAVTYDNGLSFDSVTFAGSNGTVLHRVAAGEVSATSMDAINGGQLYDLQERFADQYDRLSGQVGDLSNRFDDMADRLGDLEGNPGTGTGGSGTGVGSVVVGEGADASGAYSSAIGQGAVASGDKSSAIGQGSVASGNNSSAVGQGSVASGSNSSAVGQGSVASGENSSTLGQNSSASGANSSDIGQGSVASGANGTALGQGSVASGTNGTALGQGSVASGNNSVALGAGSVADRDNAVSVGSAGNERQITNVAAGTAPTDAVNVQQMNNTVHSARQDAMGGVAAAMAVAGLPQSTIPGRTFVSMAGSTYGGEYGSALGVSYMTRDGKWTVKASANTSSRGEVGAVIGGGFYW